MSELPQADLPGVLTEAARSVAVLTTAQRTAQTLRNAILSGQIGRGTQISESDLSVSLKVSRNTAREALRLLAAEGLVSHQPNRSPVVAVLDTADIADVFAVRKVIETGALGMQTEDTYERAVIQMRRALEQLERLVGYSDATAVIEADLAFHSALVASSGSPRLRAAFSRIENELRLCLSISTRSHEAVQELVDQHANLLTLFENHQFEQFTEVLCGHMDDAVRRVTDGLHPQPSELVESATSPFLPPMLQLPTLKNEDPS